MQNLNEPQIDAARRLLTELAQVAEHASMTRSLGGGEKAAARAFNGALEMLRAQGAVPTGMFEPLDFDTADYGSLGVQARLLLSLIREEPEAKRKDRNREGGLGAVVALAPFLDSEDLAQMIRERIDESADVSDHLLTSLAPFLDSTDLGNLVRRRMRPHTPQTPPAPPVPPAPSAPATPDLTPAFRTSSPETLDALAAQLRDPGLTTEDRQRIATRLAEMAYEQASQA